MKKLLIAYLRLSKEDQIKADESNSITNQRRLIQSYIKKHRLEDCYIIKEYADDGYSGKNLDRPGIQAVLQHINSQEVGAIIVKDFSRMARDHITMGDYIDKIFPFMQIRFIAVNNHYDSENFKNCTPNIDVPFQSLIDDYYSEETGIKVRNEFQNKRENGDFFGCIPPFGYVQNMNDHKVLVRDYEAGALVRWIFQKRCKEKMRKTEMAKLLNDAKVPTPSNYMKARGCQNLLRSTDRWQANMINRILHDPVHVGIIVNGKAKRVETGSNKKVLVPKTERLVRWNAHESSVDLKTFMEVQILDGIDYRYLYENTDRESIPAEAIPYLDVCPKPKELTGRCAAPLESRESPVKGMTVCGCCHHKMTRRTGGTVRYFCHYTYETELGCMRGTILERDIQASALAAVNAQILQAGNLKSLWEKHKNICWQAQSNKKRELKACRERISMLKQLSAGALEEYHEEKISREEFCSIKHDNITQQKEAEKRLEQLEQEIIEMPRLQNQLLDLSDDSGSVGVLTRELTEALVDRINVYSKDRIEIVFRYRDESIDT